MPDGWSNSNPHVYILWEIVQEIETFRLEGTNEINAMRRIYALL